jgi:N-acylneuraminate cytidylyltransferase
VKLAVIPARGGSKRIPRKNIKPFCGKPMIAWSIEAALASGCFDRIIVSTDDAEIAEVARARGAEVPFIRPPELADDHAGTVPVVRHAVQWCVDEGRSPQLACCIYATAPFISPTDILAGLRLLQDTGCDYAFAVTGYASPIQRALRINGEGRVEMFQPECFQARSQDLEPAYHDAAQFYWGRARAWLAETQIFNADAAPVVLPRHRVQDIDTWDDWIRAEAMFPSIQAGTETAKR